MSNGIRVLVTGGKGFIGSHLMQALHASEKNGLGTNYYIGYGYDLIDGDDILDSECLLSVALKFKPKWIVHLAAQAYLRPSQANPQYDARTNIIGTLNVLEVSRKIKCGVIFSSSGAVYGDNYQYPDPISPYGVSKLTAERYCDLYNKCYDVHAVVFRFSSVYGAGRKKTSINLIIEKMLNGDVISITGDGKQTRDFTYVSDIVNAILLAVNNKLPSGIYDVGTGVFTSINELVALIGRCIKQEPNIKYVPVVMGDPKRNELNVSKIANYGFKAKMSLTEGIKKLIEVM